MFYLKGTFVWLSGKPFAYTSWRVGEPSSGMNQNCYGIHTWIGDFGWNDALCSYTNYIGSKWRPFCEKEKTVDPCELECNGQPCNIDNTACDCQNGSSQSDCSGM